MKINVVPFKNASLLMQGFLMDITNRKKLNLVARQFEMIKIKIRTLSETKILCFRDKLLKDICNFAWFCGCPYFSLVHNIVFFSAPLLSRFITFYLMRSIVTSTKQPKVQLKINSSQKLPLNGLRNSFTMPRPIMLSQMRRA